ncbi:MAG: endonuclease/exonuclease/phosphatase [Puniceicoccaceae bacterium 5H]|nr:MAG: endonuclease/exonuclease/phosphatase [Puniceicoccaceae bacterium 5H]
MRLAAILCGLCCLVVLASAGRVRVATYNVKNYLVTDRMVDGEWRFDYPKPAAEVEALRAVIREVRPDVLALQEVGPGYLAELQRDLAAEGLDFPFAFQLQADDPTRCVAVLARVPVVEVREHRDLTLRYFDEDVPVKRGLLEVELLTDHVSWHLFTFHLKSRLTEDARDPDSVQRRAGEAEAIAAHLRERWPDGQGRFVLMGDANDAYRSPALEHLSGDPRAPLAEVWPAADSRGERWTYYSGWSDRYERIDYVLVAPRLTPWVAEGQGTIFDGPEALRASDHRLVYIDLFFPEAAPQLENAPEITDD